MADVNRVTLIGRLTRDPEMITFQSGGKLASFGFAVTGERKKNEQTGEWENKPCFLEIKAFNKQNGRKLADVVESYLAKGKLVYIEGHLILEQWTDKNDGSKRQAIRVVADEIQILTPKEKDGAEGQQQQRKPSGTAPTQSRQAPAEDNSLPDGSQDTYDGDIPF